MALRDFYANTKETGFTVSFFMEAGSTPQKGLLAAPFFTTAEPLEALTRRGCDVSLIVRFSPATKPGALRSALKNKRVRVRYFTDTTFHTKMYIVDDVALVGSANLTDAGLKANRELSILLRRDRDAAFNELPGIFDGLWNDADVLTEGVLEEYEKAYRENGRPKDEVGFESHLQKYVKPVVPTSIVEGSGRVSAERSFIQNFRRKYDEILIPAHNEILEVALASGFGRPEYAGQDPQIEMGRFLGWLRRVHGANDGWRETTLLSEPKDRAARIQQYVSVWQSADDIFSGDMYHAANEIDNITNIRTYLCDPEELKALSYDELFHYLTGCHAFLERLRFVPKDVGEDLNGLERLRISFQAENSVEDVVRTVEYLLSGPGDAIERAYDCVYGRYRLRGFGESCVMELLGWGDAKRPPFNNRAIRSIRLLGFDVEHLVARE